jgi:hypothetical protein
MYFCYTYFCVVNTVIFFPLNFSFLNIVPNQWIEYSIRGSRLQSPVSGYPRPRSILDAWNEEEDVHWRVAGASIYRLSTLSWHGFSRRAKTPTRSSRVVLSPRCLGTRSRQGFSLRAKTHTHTRRVVWSPRPTALAVGYNAKKF